MTLQEILKSKGLTDEDVESVIGEMKQNKIFTANQENLDLRYGKLKTDHESLVTRNAETQKLLEQLQSESSDDALQGKIAEYEETIQKQKTELEQFRIDSAMKIALIGAGVKSDSMDYAIYQMTHDEDWTPTLDAKGHIRGLDDRLKSFQTSNSDCFGKESVVRKIEERRIERTPINIDSVTQEEFNRMSYSQRVSLKMHDPSMYNRLQNGNSF